VLKSDHRLHLFTWWLHCATNMFSMHHQSWREWSIGNSEYYILIIDCVFESFQLMALVYFALSKWVLKSSPNFVAYWSMQIWNLIKMQIKNEVCLIIHEVGPRGVTTGPRTLAGSLIPVYKSKINNRAKCLAISQVIRAKLYNKLSHTCL